MTSMHARRLTYALAHARALACSLSMYRHTPLIMRSASYTTGFAYMNAHAHDVFPVQAVTGTLLTILGLKATMTFSAFGCALDCRPPSG